MRRLKDARRRMWPATVGSSHIRSIGKFVGGTNISVGAVVADDLICEVAVAVARVTGLGRAPHGMSMPRTCC